MKTPIARRMARWSVVAAVAAVAGAAAVLVATPATAAGTVTATFNRISSWNTGYVGDFIVTNAGTSTLTSWRLEFDLPAGTAVLSTWGATQAGGPHYTFDSLSWNATIAPGGTASFGWVATGTADPTGCLVNGASCRGGDTTPPTAPGNLRLGSPTSLSQLTVVWNPSTDNTGVVRYDVFRNGTFVGSTTATTFTVPITGFGTWSIRVQAVDAAGNVSPPAQFSLSIDPPPPTSTPTTPAP